MACTVVMVLTTFCVGISKDGTAQKTVSEFVPTYAENQVEDYPTTQGVYKFAELVYEKAGGRVEIQVNAGGVLRNEKMVIERLQFGGVDLVRVSLSSSVKFVSRLNILQMPYLYTGREYMWKVLEGPIGTNFMNPFGGSSLVPLSWYDAGIRNFYSTDRPTGFPDDMKGLKTRVQESKLMMDMVQVSGVTPVLMALGDVYLGPQAGEIDGAENNWLFYESTRYYKMAQHLILDEHTRIPELQLAAQFIRDKLPEEYRSIIRGRTRESALYEHELWAECEKIPEDRVRGVDCVATELGIREKEQFREAAAPMYEKYCSEYVDIADDTMDARRQ